jgi:hypothetical protein
MDRNVYLNNKSMPMIDWATKPESSRLMQMFGNLLRSGAYKGARAAEFEGRCVINKEYSSIKKRMRRMRRFGDLGWEK